MPTPTQNVASNRQFPQGDIGSILDVIRRRVPIGIVYSGDPNKSGEVVQRTANARPWKSYQSVAEGLAESLRRSGFTIVETVAEGSALRNAIEKNEFQLFWLNGAGIQGKAPMSHAPALLESLGYPYVGHTPLQAALLDDKILLKQWLRGVGLPTAPFIVRRKGGKVSVSKNHPDYAQEFGPHYEGPYLIKPALGRASVDISVVDEINQVSEVVEELTNRTNDRVIIEKFLLGQEYCVWASRGLQIENGLPVSRQNVMTFGQAERIFPASEQIFYKREKDNRLVDPCRRLSDNERVLRDDLAFVGRSILTGLALFIPIRVDLRLREDGLLSILEVNPKPDLAIPDSSERGLLATALDDLDMSYDDFVVKILADYLEFQLKCSPTTLSLLSPLIERYATTREKQRLHSS